MSGDTFARLMATLPTDDKGKIDALVRRVAQQNKQLIAAFVVLRQCEWIDDAMTSWCPICLGERENGGHEEDCELRAVLGT